MDIVLVNFVPKNDQQIFSSLWETFEVIFGFE